MSFSLHHLWGATREHPDKAKEVKAPEDYPKGAHFQIHVLDMVIPYSGYEDKDGPGGRVPYWRVFTFTDKILWGNLLLAYYQDRHNGAGRPSLPLQLRAFEVTAGIEPALDIRLQRT